MSYSKEIKNGVIRHISKYSKRIERLVCGVIQSACVLKTDASGETKLSFSSENANLIKLLKVYSENLQGYSGTCSLEKASKGKKGLRYYLGFSKPQSFLDLHKISCSGEQISLEIPELINHKMQRKKDYIAGFFLGSGSISDPSKSYHVEFLCRAEKQAESLVELLGELGIRAKYLNRSSFWVVYIKDSAIIADLLSTMGADSERFQFEDAKIIKEIRNRVNRQVNRDAANMVKVADVSDRQVEAIKLIERKIGLDKLSSKLREAAEIRIKNPDLSLEELGKMLDPPLGKSGMNHRLKKIEKIADGL